MSHNVVYTRLLNTPSRPTGAAASAARFQTIRKFNGFGFLFYNIILHVTGGGGCTYVFQVESRREQTPPSSHFLNDIMYLHSRLYNNGNENNYSNNNNYDNSNIIYCYYYHYSCYCYTIPITSSHPNGTQGKVSCCCR